MIVNNTITVFEHKKILFNPQKKEEREILDALENYYGHYSPYFTLIKNGVQFNSFVGIIQVGEITIEVLPKADQFGAERWRTILIDMLKEVWGFDVKSSGTSSLKIKNNSILDLYIELFIKEVELLLHKGLIKKYRKEEGNRTYLKGAIEFSKHISKNCTHQELFYVKSTEYRFEHVFNQILFKALKLVGQINTNPLLKSRIGNLFLKFPEMQNIRISETSFERLHFDRKSISYKTSIEIAKLLLLNYHPDISKGSNHVLALMFDMNNLWEQFVFVTLKKKFKSYHVNSQISKNFWKPSKGNHSKMRPDIVMTHKDSNTNFVLDTKWKNLNGYNPSPDDLRQMFTYHHYFQAEKTALLYPGENSKIIDGFYTNIKDHTTLSDKFCSVIYISTHSQVKEWQNKLVEFIDISFLS
ncbi:MAG: hypothetical protein BGO40_13270 [Chryseobacterium sp. 39-10]|nr:restriction endonuclease [Chryseobacterium sp.]OJV49094.1 MAG: hypothetical protein BGO40_13270 [Chryseobacterium sp. 39-10]